jgi:Gpi18-like mannosyltransferase
VRLPAFRSALLWGALLRVILLPLPGYAGDVNAFENWALALARGGARAIYLDPAVRPPVDYVPGYLYVLWGLGKAHDALLGAASGAGGVAFRIAIKAPGALADLLLAWILYRAGCRLAGERGGRAAAAVVLFAPPFWLVSAYWGQIDALAAVPFALALWCALEDRSVTAWICLGAALLIKPQAAAFAPVLALWQFRRLGLRALLAIGVGGAAALALAYVTALPFAPGSAPVEVLGWLAGRYMAAVAKIPFATVSAFNLYSVVWPPMHGDATPVLGVPVRYWGLALTAAALLYALAALRDRERSLTIVTTAALSAPYVLATRMHERYLFPALVAGTLAALLDATCGWIVAGFAAIFTLDTLAVLAGFESGGHHPQLLAAVHMLSAANVALFALLLARVGRSNAKTK